MGKIQDQILDEFYQQLEKADGFSAQRVEQLRSLFKESKKPKATDVVRVLSDLARVQIS
jgi:hypothetical protein